MVVSTNTRLLIAFAFGETFYTLLSAFLRVLEDPKSSILYSNLCSIIRRLSLRVLFWVRSPLFPLSPSPLASPLPSDLVVPERVSVQRVSFALFESFVLDVVCCFGLFGS